MNRESRLTSLVIFLVLFVWADSAAAQTGRDSFEPKVTPSLQVQRAAGEITVDGKLDDLGWEGAARAEGFTEIQPGDEVEPLVETAALVTYDDSFLYIGFKASGDPDDLRATLQNRDQIFQDDWVGIVLDTYGDAVNAYEIFANPYGVQGDLLMSSGNEDSGFDYIYYTEAEITADGYQVEFAIPFSTLRFPNTDVQSWRITFLRNHPRSFRHLYTWATDSRDDPCLLCQLGHLEGIAGIEPGTQLDILPALVGSQSGGLVAPEDPAQGFDNDPVTVQPSLNVNYSVTPSLLLQGTVNPDFSQIAADAAQIDVNETFALYYPERRPFFQEGSELFQTFIDVVYTRAINDPVGAVKTTGRAGETNVGFLSAVDMNSPLLLPFEERSQLVRGGESVSNILRVQRSLGESSYLGGTMTDRRLFDGGGGTVISGDAAHYFGEIYRVEGQVAVSRVEEPNSTELSDQLELGHFADSTHTIALDGEQFWGYGSMLSLVRDTRMWDVSVSYRGYNPTFRTPVGFVTNNNFHTFDAETGLIFYLEAPWVNFVNPSIYYRQTYNFEGLKKQDEIQAHFSGEFLGQTRIFSELSLTRERYRGVLFNFWPGYFLNVQSQFSKWLSVGAEINGGQEIYRSETPELGDELRLGAWADADLFERLVVGAEINWATLRDTETGEPFFDGYIARTQASFQFNRELSLRLIAQYDNFDDAMRLEPLITYRLNPYSIFYLGSTHGYGNFDAPYGWTPAQRQYFFKFQYLFQV